jgi:hypothetical protein
MAKLIREWIPSPCYSSRGGSSVRLIVLHTAEGARTIEDLGHFFQNSANSVSSHTGADNQAGRVGEYVTRGNKAWTAANANPVAVQLELCAFASWSRDMWLNQNHDMLENCAKWIAEEADHYGIPITKLSPGQAQGNGRGVCQHRDLGTWGGGHVDCGDGFPMDTVLDWARNGIPQPPDTKPERYNEMWYLDFDANGDAAVVVPNYYSDGKGRIRFGCVETSEIRVNIPGQKTETLTLRELESQGSEIPEGQRVLIVRRNSGTAPIAACFSK